MILLTKIFEKYKKAFKDALNNRIRDRKSMDNSSYSPLKNPEKLRGSNTRLNKTGEFAKNAFDVKINENKLIITPSQTMHSGNISNADILIYNESQQRIKNAPKLFPDDKTIENLDIWQKFDTDVNEEINKQVDVELLKACNEVTMRL